MVIRTGVTFDKKCEIHENGDTFWEDGCYRKYYDNGHEKEAKVINYEHTIWYYTFRDENGNIIRETKERVDGNPMCGNNRIIEAMDFESDTKNWKFPFERMTKYYGIDFIEVVRGMWEANSGSQTEEEFCEMNDITKKFFEKVIKKVK
jgi:hypothetical protein